MTDTKFYCKESTSEACPQGVAQAIKEKARKNACDKIEVLVQTAIKKAWVSMFRSQYEKHKDSTYAGCQTREYTVYDNR